jgi:O-antigen/teichoic acid export membrane protein
MQRHERMDWISRSLTVKGAASVAGLLAGLQLGGSLPFAVAGVALAWAAVLTLYDIPRARQLARSVGAAPLRPRWRWPVQARLGFLALPLGVAALLSSLQTNLPRFFVERLLGPRELGFFAAAGYLIIVGARVVTALGESASPRLAAYYARGDRRRFPRLVLRMLAIVMCIGGAAVAVALAFGKALLAFLYTSEYAAHSQVLVILMVAAAISYAALLLQYAMTASRVLKPQPLVLIASTIVTAGACVALIPRHGIVGAAVAMCAGALVQVTGNAVATGAAVREVRGTS